MSDEWIKTFADRRKVKFTNQELDERAFLTAQVEGNNVVYSIVLSDAKNPLSREEVVFQRCREPEIEPTPGKPSAPRTVTESLGEAWRSTLCGHVTKETNPYTFNR